MPLFDERGSCMNKTSPPRFRATMNTKSGLGAVKAHYVDSTTIGDDVTAVDIGLSTA